MMYGKDGRWYKVRHRSVGHQLEIYRYIQTYTDDNGYPPTLEEIAEAVHVTKATARNYLKALENAGMIKRSDAKAGMIMIVAVENYGKATG